VIGLDLSLTATGIADGTTERLRPRDVEGSGRLEWLRESIMWRVAAPGLHADLVVMEGPAYSRALQKGHHEAAGLWWLIRWSLHTERIPTAVVTPSALKKYATGKGDATKPDMRLTLYQRAGFDIRDDNECDAWWLRAMGLDHLGHPLVEVPKTHRDALAKVAWPEVTRGTA